MTKTISFLLLLGGIICLCYGAAAADSISSSFSRLFNGAPTDKTIWLLAAGTLATATGLAGVLRGAKSA